MSGFSLPCIFSYYPASKKSLILRLGFTRPHVIGFVADFFFPIWRADLFFSGFAVEFAGYVWTVAVSGKKKLRIRKYPDTCGRGLSHITETKELPPHSPPHTFQI